MRQSPELALRASFLEPLLGEAFSRPDQVSAPEAEQLLHAVRHEEQPGGDPDERPGIGESTA